MPPESIPDSSVGNFQEGFDIGSSEEELRIRALELSIESFAGHVEPPTTEAIVARADAFNDFIQDFESDEDEEEDLKDDSEDEDEGFDS